MHRLLPDTLQAPTALYRRCSLIVLAAGIILLLLLFCTPAGAQGGLMIFPKRAVFDGSARSMDLHLTNSGKETARYRVSIIQIRMKEDGGFENIAVPDPGQQFAGEHIRLFPDDVTLAPNESQTVKVQVAEASPLPTGEYRSHVCFRAESLQKQCSGLGPVSSTNAVSVKLFAVYGISIPVIIRVGESTARVWLSDLSFLLANDTLPTLNMTFHRSGNMSVYGDIRVEHVSPAGKVTRVADVAGVAVYTPNAIRRAQSHLKRVSGVNYRSGKLRVVYSASAEDTEGTLAEAELRLR
jgi:hypothetical protein